MITYREAIALTKSLRKAEESFNEALSAAQRAGLQVRITTHETFTAFGTYGTMVESSVLVNPNDLEID